MVILVDENDIPRGAMEKLEAHRRGLLHRAFSVFIFHPDGRMLLQRRAAGKYHSAGLWSNACCSHPGDGEDTQAAAERRLREEMGISTKLRPLTSFVYRAEFANGLTEYEFDHVFTGVTGQEPSPNPIEVSDYRWEEPEAIREEITAHPGLFTAWFHIAMRDIFPPGKKIGDR